MATELAPAWAAGIFAGLMDIQKGISTLEASFDKRVSGMNDRLSKIEARVAHMEKAATEENRELLQKVYVLATVENTN